MSTHTDVIIHTNRQLSPEQFDEVSRHVKGIDGVIDFYRSEIRPNFIMVAYNTHKTKALTILNKVTRLGFNARLIGI